MVTKKAGARKRMANAPASMDVHEAQRTGKTGFPNVGAIFLDEHLSIRCFTHDALALWEVELRTANGAFCMARIQSYRLKDNYVQRRGAGLHRHQQICQDRGEIRQAQLLAENIVDTVRELMAGFRPTSFIQCWA